MSCRITISLLAVFRQDNKIVGVVTLIVDEPAVQYLQLKQYIRRRKE